MLLGLLKNVAVPMLDTLKTLLLEYLTCASVDIFKESEQNRW